jgi:hypothetical protein
MAGGTTFFDYHNVKTELREFKRDGAADNACSYNDGICSDGHSTS